MDYWRINQPPVTVAKTNYFKSVFKKDNTYRLKLNTPKSDKEKYHLVIKLVKQGKM